MASIRHRLSTSAQWPSVAVFGIALLVAIQVESSLWLGGLAPLAVATIVAAFLGVPVAMSEWRLGPLPTARPFTWSLGETLLLLAVGATVGASFSGSGLPGLAAMLFGWPLLGLAVFRFGYWLGGVLVLLATVATLALVGLSVPTFDGWTLLEPHWETWRQWLPWSVIAGLLLATAGLGRWAEAPPALPGHRRVPWATTGVGLLTATAIAFGAAFTAEGHSPSSFDVALLTVLYQVALSVTALAGPAEGARRRVGTALVASLWFAGPGAAGLALFWQFLLPVGLSITIGSLAMRLRGQSSWTAWAASAAALGAALYGWPGVPAGTIDAAAAAATLVGIVWIVGTRTVIAREPA